MDDNKTTDTPVEENKASTPVEDGAAQKPKRERKPKAKKAEGQGNEAKAKEGGKGPVYRVKGAEENKDESETPQPRPQTADASADQKPKRKRAPKKKDEDAEEGKADGKEAKPRAQTAKPKYRKKGEVDEAAEEGDTPAGGEETKKGGDEPKDKGPPKNLVYQNPMDFKEKRKFKSKWEEYRHGDWRKGSGKTYVTLETEIPGAPDKLLSLPDEAAFHKKQVEVEEKIKEIGHTLEEKKTSFDEILDQKKSHLKAGDTGVVPTKELTSKFQRMKVLKEQRGAIYDAQEVATKGQADLISQREVLMKKIDRTFNTEELVPKGIKEQDKKLHTSSGGKVLEQKVIKQIEFLKNSVESIKKKEKVDVIINEQNAAKKKAGTGLQPIKAEMKQLQKEIDVIKSQQDAKHESKENFDKQLDEINERRKKLRDSRDKLYKEKEELRDNYYGALVVFQKQQYLIQDIAWMTDMKKKIQTREDEKDRRKKEYEERRERITKEREDRKQREDDRKQRMEDKKKREVDNKRIQEEQARQSEIDHLQKIQKDIVSNAILSNPMHDQITKCDSLLKFCQKSMKNNAEKEIEETKEEEGPAEAKANKELDNALKKGSIQLAQSKQDKEKEGMFQIGTGKGKKGKKANTTKEDKTIDFKLLKQFNDLKISAPLNDEDFEKTYEDLKELKEALIYWGKIIQRQNKIKYIRSAKKISNEEEYMKDAEDEEKFIENEKQKFEGDDVSEKTTLKLDKLKIAQVIDRENKTKASDWEHPDDDEEDDESDENVFRPDDVEEDEDGQMHIRPKKGGRGGGLGARGGDDTVVPKGDYYKKPKAAKRPTQAKFSEIMKNDTAFPSLENEDEEDADADYDETPEGDIEN